MRYLTLLLVFVTQLSFAQSTSLDKLISDIDIQEDTILTVYNWITYNIKYDVKKLETITERRKPSGKKGSKSEIEYKQQMLDKVIKSKKGVCEDYSLLLHEIVTELGYQSYVVEGMTKNQNGNINKRIGHAWNAIKVDGGWKLYDATWGAGYISDKNKFVKEYKSEWYETSPTEMLNTHLPFDPIWQLSNKPINYSQFKNGMVESESDIEMDYPALIDTHFAMEEKSKILTQIERSKKNGDDVRLLNKWQKYLQQKVDMYEVFSQPEIIEIATQDCQTATDLYNECQKKGKAKNYNAKKWNLDYSKAKMMEAKSKLEFSISSLESIKVNDSKARRNIGRFVTQAERLLKRVEAELDYIEEQQ